MNDDILLSAQNLSVRFGGVLAVNNVSFDVKRGEVFTLIGPNGAGKTTVFNLISRIYTPTTGVIDYAGPQGQIRLTDQPPHQIAGLGIGDLPAWLAEPEIAVGRLVEKALAEPRPAMPCHIAWRTRQIGKALDWFLNELDNPEQIESLTAGL